MKNTVKNFMFYIAFVASLGGLLFGFDTAVISGAEKSIQTVYGLSDFSHGFTIAIALIGTIIGAFICSKPVEKYGRLKALKIIAFLYFVSAVGSAAIIDWYSFLFFRFAGGLAVGASSVVGPMYIAEISPSRWRGRFVAFFQFNIVLGIVLAYFSNYWIHGIAHDWQWMLGVEAIPAIVFALLLYTVPESPRWLVKQNKETEARRIIKEVSNADIEQEVHEIRESLVATGNCGEKLFQRKYRKPILYAFLIATFNQLSGINAILYYAPRIFEMSGVFTDSAMMQSIVIGLTNLTFTMIGMILIDQVGRKKLLYIGSIGMAVGAFAVAMCDSMAIKGVLPVLSIIVYAAFFMMSWGPICWVLISEIFPNTIRGKAVAIAVAFQWIFNYIVSSTFPALYDFSPMFAYSLYGIICVAAAIFVWRWVPETKGKTLEDMSKLWKKNK